MWEDQLRTSGISLGIEMNISNITEGKHIKLVWNYILARSKQHTRSRLSSHSQRDLSSLHG